MLRSVPHPNDCLINANRTCWVLDRKMSGYQESRRAASDTFLPRYIRDDSARAHVKHKRERYAENRNNQHGLLKACGAERFRDRG